MRDPKMMSDTIGLIYEASLNPAYWPDVLARVSTSLRSTAASVHTHNPTKNKVELFVEHGTDPVFTALLHSTYAAMSPIGASVLMANLDQPVSSFDFVPEDEFVKSRFYLEWMQPQGYHEMLGALIAKRPSEVGAISLTRTRQQGRFDDADRDFLGLLSPHVRRSVTISGLLEQRVIERNSFAAVMDQLSVAVVLVDRSSGFVRANPAGHRSLDEGFAITLNNGLVKLVDPVANRTLKEALLTTATIPQFIGVSAQGIRYLAALTLIEPRLGTFALFVNRDEAELPALGQHLAALYGLTPREVCMLMPLLQGATIDDIADTMGIAVATARTHLNNLFAKTGTSRQADLVQKVLKALPPLIG